VKLLLDMNVSPRLTSLLVANGIDAVHWSELGPVAASDQSIADRAVSVRAIIVTHDLDFGALLSSSGDLRPSVIQIRGDDLSVERLLDRLLLVCTEFSDELTTGALITLDIDNTRVRLLPIHQ
jgi:predicted nuclease of predicted toxin-antitoxin system